MKRLDQPAGKTTRLLYIAIVVSLAVTGCALGETKSAPGSPITIGLSDDPAKHMLLWALQNGKVDTGGLDIRVTYLPNQSALQAYQSRQFNVVEASPVGVALGAQKGLTTPILTAGLTDTDATVVDVTAASGITAPAQLRGRKVAISSPTGSSTIQTQYVLSKLYGLNTRLQGGDITFQPTAPEALVSVLNNGGVDAATNLNKPRYLLEHTPGYKPVLHVSQDVHKALGAYPVTTVLATYPEVERDRKADLTKLTTTLRASVDYARSHKQELAAEIGGANPGDVDYLSWWWSTTDPKYGGLSQQDVAGIQAFWTMANAVGQLADVPTFDTLRSAAAPAQ